MTHEQLAKLRRYWESALKYEQDFFAESENRIEIGLKPAVALSLLDHISSLESRLSAAQEVIREMGAALQIIGDAMTNSAMEAASTDNFESMADAYFELNRDRRRLANAALQSTSERKKRVMG